MSDDFTNVDKNEIGRLKNIRKRHKKIVKQTAINLTKTVKIEANETALTDRTPESVEPIVEDGMVVGMIFTCSCHRSTEIRFEMMGKDEN